MEDPPFYFLLLPLELRSEILLHCPTQTLGRFIQTSKHSENVITKTVWQKRIEEIGPTDVWGKLKKATKKGDLKLLCAIFMASTVNLNDCTASIN